MKIYESAVRKPISTILIFVAVVLLGSFSLRNLAVDMYPDVEFPYIMVMTTYVGANASDIETNVSRVLEDNLNTVNNLKNIYSTSRDNMSIVSLEFTWGADLNEAANDIRDAVGRAKDLMPDEVDDPLVLKISSSMMPVMVLAVTADESYYGLNKLLDEQLVNRLNRINGVGAVSLMGAPVREIQVNLDPRKMQAYNLSVEQIGAVIAQENVNVPAGTMDIGNNTFNIKTDAEFTSSDDLYDVIVANYGGADVFLRDVASIRDTIEKQTLDERINGERGVRVVVQKQSGANTINIVNKINEVLPSIQANLPSDIHIATVMDSSQSIRDSVGSLTETVMFAFLFVILVVLFFLGRWRATFIICLTIPVSMIVAFIYLYLTGSTINIISLSSLTIGIGLVVDDAIVVLENITKHIERGSSPREAAIYGTNEVWLSVIATSLTVIAVFLPMTMVGGQAGIMFKELGWIVAIVVAVSTVTAVTLTPMLAAQLLKTEHGHTYKGLGIIFKPIDRFLRWLDAFYARLLAWVLRRRTLVMVTAVAVFVGGILLMKQVPTEFISASDSAAISMTVQLEQNTGVEFTSGIARQIDSIIYTNFPEIEIMSTSAGSSSTNSFTALFSTASGSHVITYMMRLPSLSEREPYEGHVRNIFQISDLIRLELDKIPEITKYSVTPGGGIGNFGGAATVDIKIFGYDFEETNAIAHDLRDRVAMLDGTRDVTVSREDMRPEYNVVLDRNKLAFHGLNSATVSMMIRNRINGYEASKYREDGEEYDIVVRYDEEFRMSLEDIEDILIYNSRGQAVRVGDVGRIVEEFAPPAISRENRQRVVTVAATLGAGVALGTVVEGINGILDGYELPDDVFIEIGGSFEDMQESFADLGMLLLIVVVLVYVVMATQFESFVYPFIIMITMLVAFPGVIFALWLTGIPLGLMALIGAIMLVGIVVKNGIVMVDFMNLLRERGLSITNAVVEGGKSRLRPVLMTSLTTILGMLPLAIGFGEGSEMWQPMGISIIGGLTFSTTLTLLVVPVMYSLFGGAGIARRRRQIRDERRKQRRNNETALNR